MNDMSKRVIGGSHRFDHEVGIALAIWPELEVPVPRVLGRSQIRKPDRVVAIEPFVRYR
jgi:hypothetical protein